MSTPAKVFIKNLKQKIEKWDEAFDRLQIKDYPLRLLARVQYREQIEALIVTRLLVEERLVNFDQRLKLSR